MTRAQRNHSFLNRTTGLIFGTLLALGCNETAESTELIDARDGSEEVTIEADQISALDYITATLPSADRDVQMRQRRVLQAPDDSDRIEQLGWAWVQHARDEHDAGSYGLALRAAEAMEERGGDPSAIALLKGHTLHAQHRFAEAEALAREVTEARGLPMDFGLLGDVLLDRGDLKGAEQAYQQMMDRKPDAHAFMRAAALRYALGDVSGAEAAMHQSARSISPRHLATLAWAWAEVARFRFEAARDEPVPFQTAAAAANHATRIEPRSAHGWWQLGRILLATGEMQAAIDALDRAARYLPSPEIRWTHAEALTSAGASARAEAILENLRREQNPTDPRSLSLFLASREGDRTRALSLARDEVAARRDALSIDALAWALRANDELPDAIEAIRRALASGIRNARVYLHGGVIAAETGEYEDARAWLREAAALRHALLPSEQQLLDAFLSTPPATSLSS